MDEEKIRINVYYIDRETKGLIDVCYFYTSVFSEWIRALKFCKEFGVIIYPKDNDERVNQEAYDKLNGIGGTIEDFWLELGSDDLIQSIEVVLE